MQKSIVIIGPTASGKSDLAIKMALEKNGEIISVDSRQIYRDMDIGTGKVTSEEQHLVPHHLLDICDPGEAFNVTDFQLKAGQIEADIRSRGKLPIFCGGSLFWIESYLQGAEYPPVSPDHTLRARLEMHRPEELFRELQKLDPKRAATIDPHNKVRLIRALEIIEHLGQVPERKKPADWEKNYQLIVLNPDTAELRNRIQKRLNERLDAGMIEEVQKLLDSGTSHQWLQKIGLEYKYVSLYLEGKFSLSQMEERLFHAICHYAKRQKTYLKKFK